MPAELNPKTASAQVTLIKGATLRNKAGRFENGKPQKIHNLEHIAFLKPKPNFQVQELDEEGKVVFDSQEGSKKAAKPQRVVKMKKPAGDGWDEVRLDDKDAEAEREKQREAWSKIEAEWAEEEKGRTSVLEDDPADELVSYAEPELTPSEKSSQVMKDIFQPKETMPWTPAMKIAQLRKALDSRGVDHSGLKYKRDLISALEATEE